MPLELALLACLAFRLPWLSRLALAFPTSVVQQLDGLGAPVRSSVARTRLRSCSSLVALAMGAVMPGRAINQASATSAGFAFSCFPASSNAARMRSPRCIEIFLYHRAARASV